MSPAVVRWRFTPANTRSLRLLVYAAVGLTVGPLVGFVGVVLSTLVRNDGIGVLVLVIALLVGLGVGSGRMLFALASDEVPTTTHEDTRALSRWWLVGSALAGAGLGLWAVLRTSVGFQVLVGSVGTGFLALVVGAGLRSEGAIDRDENTIEYDGHTVSLDAVRRVRSVQVGSFVLALLGYQRGQVGPSTPRFLVLSVAGLDALESTRGSGTGATTEALDETHTAPVAVRWIAAAFGLACLVAGPVLWVVLPPNGGRLLAAYLGLFGLLFGAVFLRYAIVA